MAFRVNVEKTIPTTKATAKNVKRRVTTITRTHTVTTRSNNRTILAKIEEMRLKTGTFFATLARFVRAAVATAFKCGGKLSVSPHIPLEVIVVA